MALKIKDGKEFGALNFLVTIGANVDNKNLSDIEFRQFVKKSLNLYIEEE